MTVPTEENPRRTYTGSGTGPYPITFTFSAKEDVVVTHVDSGGNENTLTYVTDYSISDPPTNEITTVISYPAAEKIVLTRGTAKTQTVDLKENRAYSAEILEGMMDKLTLIAQELVELATRSIIASPGTDENFDATLPPVSPGAAIGFSSGGGGLTALTDLTTGAYGTPNEWTAQQNFDQSLLTIDTGLVYWNWNYNQVAALSLTENAVLQNPTNMNAGSCARLHITNTGAFTLGYGANYDWGVDGPPVMPTGAGEEMVLDFYSPDGTAVYAQVFWASAAF